MSELVLLSPVSPAVPARVVAVAERLEARRLEIRSTFSEGGGITRRSVSDVVEPSLRSSSFIPGSHATLSPKEIDYVSVELGTAVSIQAGRAMTNNGALLAVLAAASSSDIDWLILLVPDRYKGSATYDSVLSQLRDLEVASGIRLDLQGVLAVGY